MESNAPFPDNNIDELLRKYFLELDHNSPKNEKTMEILTKHVTGSNVFISHHSFLKKMQYFFKPWVLLCIALVSSVLIFFPGNDDKPPHKIKAAITSDKTERGDSKKEEEKREEKSLTHTDQERRPQETTIIRTIEREEDTLYYNKEIIPAKTIKIQPAKSNKPDNNKPSITFHNNRLPNLTEEEIKDNNKQKKRMIDKLIKMDKSTWKFIPAGHLQYKNEDISLQSFGMRSTEITNLEYRTFLFDLLISGRKEDFIKCRPAHHLWTARFKNVEFNNPMEEHYFSHPAYNEYPVVNISWENAVMFCEWLTAEANSKLKAGGKQLINPLRIPSEYEWIYAAMGGNPALKNSTGSDSLKNPKSCYLSNFSCLIHENARYDSTLKYWVPKDSTGFHFMNDGAFHTAAVTSYTANGYGLFCMSGNVSEMI